MMAIEKNSPQITEKQEIKPKFKRFAHSGWRLHAVSEHVYNV